MPGVAVVGVIEWFSDKGNSLGSPTPDSHGRGQPPNGMGPRCSATGPSTAAGRNSNAPSSRMLPSSTNPKVTVSVRMVPDVKGVGFLRAKPAARAMGAMIGTKRLISITRPQAMSHCGLSGAGGDGLSSALLKPQVSPSPSNPEPLLAEADENSYT